MHEMSITQGIIEICQKHAGSRKVTALDIEIGALSGVVPDSIEFCFEACSQNTVLEGAKLNIISISGRGLCSSCGSSVPMQTLYDCCIKCGSFSITIEEGEEMRVREIEVED